MHATKCPLVVILSVSLNTLRTFVEYPRYAHLSKIRGNLSNLRPLSKLYPPPNGRLLIASTQNQLPRYILAMISLLVTKSPSESN